MTETHRENRVKIISCIRYLARQGLPFREHGDEKDANFKQLTRFRAEDDPAFGWKKRLTLHLRLRMKYRKTWAYHSFVMLSTV